MFLANRQPSTTNMSVSHFFSKIKEKITVVHCEMERCVYNLLVFLRHAGSKEQDVIFISMKRNIRIYYSHSHSLYLRFTTIIKTKENEKNKHPIKELKLAYDELYFSYFSLFIFTEKKKY